jgi:hypothetical protein
MWLRSLAQAVNTHNWYWLHETLTVAQLIRKFPDCYGTRNVCHWSLSEARRIQSEPFHTISLRSVLILSSHLLLGLLHGIFRSCFPNHNFVCISHHSHACYMPCPSHSPRLDHPNNVVKRTSYEAPHYAVFRHCLPIRCNIFLNTLFSDTLNPCSSFNVKDEVKFVKIWTQWKQAFSEFSLLSISSWMQLWFVTVIPKYLNFVTFSKGMLATGILWFDFVLQSGGNILVHVQNIFNCHKFS